MTQGTVKWFNGGLSGGLCVPGTASQVGMVMRMGGNGDQLVRLAYGARVVDGGRHRQFNLLFSSSTPHR